MITLGVARNGTVSHLLRLSFARKQHGSPGFSCVQLSQTSGRSMVKRPFPAQWVYVPHAGVPELSLITLAPWLVSRPSIAPSSAVVSIRDQAQLFRHSTCNAQPRPTNTTLAQNPPSSTEGLLGDYSKCHKVRSVFSDVSWVSKEEKPANTGRGTNG